LFKGGVVDDDYMTIYGVLGWDYYRTTHRLRIARTKTLRYQQLIISGYPIC